MIEPLVFHIDANSAFLSWTAVDRLQNGESLDIRTIPAVIGGNEESRHGIVLAKSISCKPYKIQTGETLFSARQKCPILKTFAPDYNIYMRCSSAMNDIFKEYTPQVHKYSIDESFLNFTGMELLYPDPIKVAYEIKDRVKNELGFTVSVGISSNKLLAKMASEFKKPDGVSTCFPEEIPSKMWILPIEDLFMVGNATAPKLHKMGIHTIGDLAKCDLEVITYKLKKHGLLIWNYANGIDNSCFNSTGNYFKMKGIGNSTTTHRDVTDKETAYLVLISLVESVAMRLRNADSLCQLVSVSIRNKDFINYSHQRKLHFATDSTREIIQVAKILFDEIWRNEPIRHFGVHLSHLCSNEFRQLNFFNYNKIHKQIALDKAIDDIRFKYSSNSLVRSAFLHSGLRAVNGGMGAENYPVMSSFL